MLDSYSLVYDCELEIYGEDGLETIYTSIEIDVSLDSDNPRTYTVDYYLKNPPTIDLEQDIDMFFQVEDKLLSDLAAEGIKKSMLVYDF